MGTNITKWLSPAERLAKMEPAVLESIWDVILGMDCDAKADLAISFGGMSLGELANLVEAELRKRSFPFEDWQEEVVEGQQPWSAEEVAEMDLRSKLPKKYAAYWEPDLE